MTDRRRTGLALHRSIPFPPGLTAGVPPGIAGRRGALHDAVADG